MRRFALKFIPSVFLKHYNRLAIKYKFRNQFISIGSFVSIVNSNLGMQNIFGSNVTVSKVSAGNNLNIGSGGIIENCTMGNNNNISSLSQINYSILGNSNIVSANANIKNSKIGNGIKIYSKAIIQDAEIGDFTYIGESNFISKVNFGKFCSVGPNLFAGWGIHPSNGLSTHPMFYSTRKQNGMTLSEVDKIVERKTINIGNDVFIGMNVLILDGVEIGDGAMIGAGAVVSKNIPPYAIAVGSPIQIIKYRFSPEIIENLLEIKWWDWDMVKLKEIEKHFDDIEGFVRKFKKRN